MNNLSQAFLSTLLTPITFGLAVVTAWVLRNRIRDIVKSAGITEIGVTKEGGLYTKFDPEKFAKETYHKQGMGAPSSEDVKEVATLVHSLAPLVVGRRILWVDNHPENNRLERAALITWGVEVQTRRSTEEAMTELRDAKDTPYDLVVSDWFRKRQPEGQRLGEMMHSESINVPILFYFSVGQPALFNEIQGKARELLAVGATSSPRELLRWVFAELVHASLRDKQGSFAL